MQTIKSILAERTGDDYFQDCTLGQAIQARRDQVTRDSWVDHADLSERELWHIIGGLVSERRYRILLSRARKKKTLRKNGLLDLVAELLGEEAATIDAARSGCASYSGCIQCPRGQELAAREIYAYAMGGA